MRAIFRRVSGGFLALAAGLLLHAPAHASVADLSQQWAGYWNAGNVSGVVSVYAEHPILLPGTGHAWNGKSEIRAKFRTLLKAYAPHIALHSEKFDRSGALAYDTGTYDAVIDRVKGGAPISVRGHYLFVFVREHRRWKILEQAFTELKPVKL